MFLLAIVISFLIGTGITAALLHSDRAAEHPVPLENGQTVDLSPFGFTLRVPETYNIRDLTEDGSTAWLALILGDETDQFYIYSYLNDSADTIDDYEPLDMIRYYMQSGCDQVRTYTFGGRTFVSYRAAIESLTGDEYWTVFETWNPDLHLVIETQMSINRLLPILATFSFTDDHASLPAS
ncbi:MAG: hypothetical protein IJ242_02235 [Clostridia bacterium]|nr:hypothetical protein [Clostridia bacterium]